VDFRRLDLDVDPEPQGFAPGSFDLVAASNAVHATADLRASLARLLRLLAPGGVLLLVESTLHHDWFDMTTGLVEGWQKFADDLRGDNPLLPAEAWVGALRQAGFADAGAWPRPGSAAGALGLHVVVARAPGEAVAGAAVAEAAAVPDPVAPEAPRAADAGAALARRVLEALPAERVELLREFVRERVMRVLRLEADRPPDRQARLMDLGFDSLMAVQLRNQLSSGLRLPAPLPATVLFDYPTIDRLAARLADLLAPPAPAAAASVAPAAAPPRVAQAAVEAMTDAEVEALLLERLGGKR
jgi:SAM-dependent methyltransferase